MLFKKKYRYSLIFIRFF